MPDHELKQLIQAADRAITAEDFDTLMGFYAEDATLVIQPDRMAAGKQQIRKAFTAIAEHFNHKVKVSQGDMRVIEAGDTALVIMETIVDAGMPDATDGCDVRRATYVFRREMSGNWLCVIDNSYGTALLDG